MMNKIKFKTWNKQDLTVYLSCHTSLASPQSQEHWCRSPEPQPLREALGGGFLKVALKTSPWEMEAVLSDFPTKEP